MACWELTSKHYTSPPLKGSVATALFFNLFQSFKSADLLWISQDFENGIIADTLGDSTDFKIAKKHLLAEIKTYKNKKKQGQKTLP